MPTSRAHEWWTVLSDPIGEETFHNKDAADAYFEEQVADSDNVEVQMVHSQIVKAFHQ